MTDEPLGLRSISGKRIYSGISQSDWMELAGRYQREGLVRLIPGTLGSGAMMTAYVEVVLTDAGNAALAPI